MICTTRCCGDRWRHRAALGIAGGYLGGAGRWLAGSIVAAAAANLTVESINEDVDLTDNEPPSTFGQQERDAPAGNEVEEATTSESKNGNDVLDQEQVLGHAVHPAKDPEMDSGNWINSLF